MESMKSSKLTCLITSNVDHTIELLKTEDNTVLNQALTSLLDYSEESPKNASILFQKDVIGIFTSLLKKVKPKNLILIVKIILEMMKNVPECLEHIIFATNTPVLYEINDLFLMTNDGMLQRLSADLLSNVSENAEAANKLVKTNVVSTIFSRLKTGDDVPLKFSLIHYLESLLVANHAKNVFINCDLPLEVLFRCTTIPICIIQNKVFNILDTLISWKSYAVEILLRRAEVIEKMLNYIMNDDHKLFHDRAVNVIYDYCESSVTASYFIDSTEFINFCRWSKTCEDKHILFSAAFMALLTKSNVTRQKLIRNSIDNTVLSYIRCNDPPTFYKNCQMFCNLIRSASCPLSIINDDVVCYMLEMLQRNDPEFLPYKEMALKSLSFFLVWRLESLSIFLRNDGINIFYKALQNWNQFTNDGLISVMKLIDILHTSDQLSVNLQINFALDCNLYEIILQCLSKSTLEVSKQALLILNMYLKDDNFTKHFLEFNGPKILVKKLEHIDDDDFYQTILSFIYNLIPIAGLGKHLLLQTDIFRILNSFGSLLFRRCFKLRQVVNLLCELHHELKFYKYGFLSPEIICDNGFYVINDTRGFCFIENMLENCASPFYNMYIVNSVEPPVLEIKKEQNIKEEPCEETPAVSNPDCKTSGFSIKLETKIFSSLCDEKINETPSVNYRTLSPDPFLMKQLEKLTPELCNAKLNKKVEILARYVAATIRQPISIHAFFDHIMQLKGILGTSMIPIGYLRFGYECERALLFKVLADKLKLPVSLNRGRPRRITRDFMYWNEIVIEYNDKYIIDLMVNVGDLIRVGHPKAYKYCNMTNTR